MEEEEEKKGDKKEEKEGEGGRIGRGEEGGFCLLASESFPWILGNVHSV